MTFQCHTFGTAIYIASRFWQQPLKKIFKIGNVKKDDNFLDLKLVI